jgi:hypothetical protein
MTQFTVYTADPVPEAAKPSLEAAKASFGFIPNLQGTTIASTFSDWSSTSGPNRR